MSTVEFFRFWLGATGMEIASQHFITFLYTGIYLTCAGATLPNLKANEYSQVLFEGLSAVTMKSTLFFFFSM
jgi:hypothetical protein